MLERARRKVNRFKGSCCLIYRQKGAHIGNPFLAIGFRRARHDTVREIGDLAGEMVHLIEGAAGFCPRCGSSSERRI